MAGVLQITYGYEQVIDRFDQSSFFKVVLMVNQAEAVLLHVSLGFDYQVEFVLIEPLEQRAVVALVSQTNTAQS